MGCGRKTGFYVPVKDVLSLNKLREVYWVWRSLELKAHETLLDIGCGTGFWTRQLSRVCRFAVGIDVQVSQISQIRGDDSKRHMRVAAEAEKLPFFAKSFDKVVSICALEHFQSDTQAISEMYRVMKDDGLLVMTVDSLTHPAVDHAYREFHRKKYFVNHYYDLETVQLRLEEAGFELQKHQFIINSAVSVRLLRFFHGNPQQRAILVPVLMPLALLADHLKGDSRSGVILALTARKKGRSSAGRTPVER